MRRAARSMVVLFVALLGIVGLAVASTITAAIALAATALIVPGTGTPNANIVANYRENARDRYISPFDPSCTAGTDCTLTGINYPASFFPLVIFPGWCRSGPDGCAKWDVSVGKGTDALNAALKPYLDSNSTEEVVIFGYSQGGAVVSNVLQDLGSQPPEVKERLSVVTIGGIENPDGGLWSRFGFLPTIPFFDITFGPPMRTDTGIPVTAIGFQYDPVTYAPLYFGNPFAVLNAVTALLNVHGRYLVPDGNGPTDTLPYGYTNETLADQLDCGKNPGNCRTSGTNTYIMVPATSLPLANFVLGVIPAPLTPIVKPVVDFLTPVTKVLVDLGYDFSGDPNVPRPLSILPFNPFQNFFEVGADLAAAVGEGAQAAFGDLGGSPTTPAPPNPVPGPSAVSVLAGSAPSARPLSALSAVPSLRVSAATGSASTGQAGTGAGDVAATGAGGRATDTGANKFTPGGTVDSSGSASTGQAGTGSSGVSVSGAGSPASGQGRAARSPSGGVGGGSPASGQGQAANSPSDGVAGAA